MTTARLAALRARVSASTKINSAAKAENEKLKLELKEKQEEYKEVLLLKKETLESLSGAMFEAENNQLRADIAAKEAAIIKEMAAIEAMLEGEEAPLPVEVPEVKPVTPVLPVTSVAKESVPTPVKAETNGKAKPPEDGGAGWCLIDDSEDPDENEFNQEANGWVWKMPQEDADEPPIWIPVEFWGPKVGVTVDPDGKWSTHFRVVKR